MFKLMLLLALASCDDLKDHPAQCGEIIECSDGSFDYDGDGYCANDCDDDSCDVNPGAPEVCNGTDDDCDGKIDGFDGDIRSDDEYDVVKFYVDKDMDGSPSDDEENVCVRRDDDVEYYDCDDILTSMEFGRGCGVDSTFTHTPYYEYCDEDEPRQLFCLADAGGLKKYVEDRKSLSYDVYEDGLFDCCDKESDLGCERGTEPICQYPVEATADMYECGPVDECVPYRTDGYRLP